MILGQVCLVIIAILTQVIHKPNKGKASHKTHKKTPLINFYHLYLSDNELILSILPMPFPLNFKCIVLSLDVTACKTYITSVNTNSNCMCFLFLSYFFSSGLLLLTDIWAILTMEICCNKMLSSMYLLFNSSKQLLGDYWNGY